MKKLRPVRGELNSCKWQIQDALLSLRQIPMRFLWWVLGCLSRRPVQLHIPLILEIDQNRWPRTEDTSCFYARHKHIFQEKVSQINIPFSPAQAKLIELSQILPQSQWLLY